MAEDHVSKRATPLGRWLPLALYSVNMTLWIIAGIAADALDRLWLVSLPLPALGLYLWRTRRQLA